MRIPASGPAQPVFKAVPLQSHDCCELADVLFVIGWWGAGCGEWRMLMGCGVAPRGCLRLAHLAAKLTPTISGGPHMPVSPPPYAPHPPHPLAYACRSPTACVCMPSSIVVSFLCARCQMHGHGEQADNTNAKANRQGFIMMLSCQSPSSRCCSQLLSQPVLGCAQ